MPAARLCHLHAFQPAGGMLLARALDSGSLDLRKVQVRKEHAADQSVVLSIPRARLAGAECFAALFAEEYRMALWTVLRAAFGYLVLVLIVRVVGRRPGKQLTPFEFVLIFYLGGLTLTGMVGTDASLTNAVCQIVVVAFCHYALSQLRFHSALVARLLDGVPLILLSEDGWRTETLSKTKIADDDVMDVAREHGIRELSGIEMAVLETYGEITVIPKSPDQS